MEMKKGKFIVIEGVDGSGKTTQFELLKEKLEKEKYRVLIADFPRYYSSTWGKLLGELLRGKYGNFISVNPYLTVFPYMVDQYTWSRDIGKPWLMKGGYILSNRYFTSNVHQVAKFRGKARSIFRNWLWTAGYDDFGILKPDLVLFLDVDPKIARKLNTNKKERLYLKGRKKDLAERDYEHQKAAYKEYLYSVKTFDYWRKVRCTTNNFINPPEVIHQKVWKTIQKYF
jgi:dTMP kinase